jgi:hypothetical protein
MTEPRGDQGFSVAPSRIGGDRGDRGRRRGRLRVALVFAIAAGIVTIAWLGPRLSARPNLELSFFATPTPSPTRSAPASVRPTTSLPVQTTPLPEITRPDGSVVIGRVGIQSDSLRVLDLSNGGIVTGPPAQFGQDAVFLSPGGDGWTCICFEDVEASIRERIVRIVATTSDGIVADSTDLTKFEITASDPNQPDLMTDVDVFDGGQKGLLAVASRVGEVWQFSVAPIAIEGRKFGPIVDIGALTKPGVPTAGPSGEPLPTDLNASPYDAYVDGPHVRVAPGGRYAFVWAVIQRSVTEDSIKTTIGAWRITLEPDGSIGETSTAEGFQSLPMFCTMVGFAAEDRLAWLCPHVTFGSGPGSIDDRNWEFGTVGPDGGAAGKVSIVPAADGYFSEPLFDRANGQVYVWDASGLSISRIDTHSLGVETAIFDAGAQAATGHPVGGGRAKPAWHDADSAVQQLGFSQLAGGLKDDRIYALGVEQQAGFDSLGQGSLGVFVIDRSTLALVDRWAPAADYLSVAALADGSIAASGMAGLDETGHEAPWQSSLTIYDPAEGRILARFGQLGEGIPPLVVDH